ncbi:MAG: formylmethanofuran dehydrogenase subunit A [Candidatus Helarchaeota archaeon]
MARITIKNGLVIDPINKIKDKMDITIENGRIVEGNSGQVIDASGKVVFPGGVDIHSHIAGSKVNSGRVFRPEDHRRQPIAKTSITRSGTGYSVPSTFVTGYKYAQMGYTTVVEPAMPPLKARHTHEEFKDIPIIDKLAMPVFGNNWFVLDAIAAGDLDLLTGYIAWLLRATKGYAVKIVNPGGVENWGWGKNVDGLDDTVLNWEVTPRKVVSMLCQANERLNLPHTIHVHGNQLGHPGCSAITRDTWDLVKEFKGTNGRKNVLHYTHTQFNAYGGTNWKDFKSDAAMLAEYVNSNEHVTLDIGQVIFGDTTTMTGDGPWEFNLQHLGAISPWGNKGGMKWINGQIESECGSGVVPYVFAPKNPVNAVQWAIGLELILLLKDPWRTSMTTDHPNGGPFENYPLVIAWLMSKKAREEMLAKVHDNAKQKTTLNDIDREYTLEEIAIITRAGNARTMGLTDRGHLGVGAVGDVAIYDINPEEKDPRKIEKAFSRAAYTIKNGEIVVKDGEIVKTLLGDTLWVDVKLPDSIEQKTLDYIKDQWRMHYTVNLNNYPVQENEIHNPKRIAIEAK